MVKFWVDSKVGAYIKSLGVKISPIMLLTGAQTSMAEAEEAI